MTPTGTELRAATSVDDEAIARIYNHYIEHSTATFEVDPIGAEELRDRRSRAPRDVPWQVAVDGAGAVLGYAYVASWKPRAAYDDTVESSVYVDPAAAGRGIGARLYEALLPLAWSAGFHAILAGICLPNDPSVRLHERFGYEPVGVLRQVGYKFGQRIDVGYWELLRPAELGPSQLEKRESACA